VPQTATCSASPGTVVAAPVDKSVSDSETILEATLPDVNSDHDHDAAIQA